MKTILLLSEKPFAAEAVTEMSNVATSKGYKLVITKGEDKNALKDLLKNADALIVRSDKVNAEITGAAPQLKVVVRAGAGYDNLDLADCTAKGITAMNTPGQNSGAVAELVVAMALFMSRNCFGPGTGQELKGKTLGLHAFGNVSKALAKMAQGMGMKVIAYARTVRPEMAEMGVTPVDSVETLYKSSNFVSIHIPANENTKGSINSSLLSLLPKNAILINTARKEVINEKDLCELMNSRNDLKYISDLKPDNHDDMLKFGKRYFTTDKKIGAETEEANLNAGLAAVNQICDFFEKGDMRFKVNK